MNCLFDLFEYDFFAHMNCMFLIIWTLLFFSFELLNASFELFFGHLNYFYVHKWEIFFDHVNYFVMIFSFNSSRSSSEYIMPNSPWHLVLNLGADPRTLKIRTCVVWTTGNDVIIIPSNNFAENPRKFSRIFPGNPRKFPGIFHRKIRWKCRQLFPGIFRNPFRGTRSEEFLVTHSEEFLVTNSSEKPEKICSKKVFRTNSWEFPGNYSQDFLKSSSGISWNIH